MILDLAAEDRQAFVALAYRIKEAQLFCADDFGGLLKLRIEGLDIQLTSASEGIAHVLGLTHDQLEEETAKL